jgi:AcrR family transcriptional regulator
VSAARTSPPARTSPSARAAGLAGRLSAEAARLDVSHRVVALFLRAKTSDFSVEDLARRVGISTRTFYRYFPRKEDAIRPHLDDSIARIVAAIRARPRHESLRQALIAAYAIQWTPQEVSHWKILEQVLAETESLRAVWLQVITDSERGITRVAAEWLGLPEDSRRARLIGTVTVAAVRVAMAMVNQSPRLAASRPGPSVIFEESLEELGPDFFEPRRETAAATVRREASTSSSRRKPK